MREAFYPKHFISSGRGFVSAVSTKGEKLEKIRKKKRKREKERERERETKKKIRKRENGGRHVWSYVEGCCEVPRASVD